MANNSKVEPGLLGPEVSVVSVRHIDKGDPWIDAPGKVQGDLKVPPKDHGDPSGEETVVSMTQFHLPDLHRGEDDEDDKKKRAEAKAQQAERLAEARGEQADHFIKEEFPAPDDTSPPKPNERIGMANRTQGG